MTTDDKNMGNQDGSAKVVSIMSRNSDIAYRLYRQKFYDAMDEYRVWRRQNMLDQPMVTEWYSLAKGFELKHQAQMWLKVCLKLKDHMNKHNKMMCL